MQQPDSSRVGLSNVQYIFWSGGYASTFRILSVLSMGADLVQPIFISTPDADVTSLINNMSKFYDINKKIINGRLLPLWHIRTYSNINDVADQFGFPMQDCSDYSSMKYMHNILICAEKGQFQLSALKINMPVLSIYMRYPCAYMTRRAMRKYARRHGFNHSFIKFD